MVDAAISAGVVPPAAIVIAAPEAASRVASESMITISGRAFGVARPVRLITPMDVILSLMNGYWPASPMPDSAFDGLCARIVAHSKEVDILDCRLAATRFALCAGPDWLKYMISRPQSEWLQSFGITDGANCCHSLVVFRPHLPAFAASWGNLFDHAIPAAFPAPEHETLQLRVLAHRRAAMSAQPFGQGHTSISAEEYLSGENTLDNCLRFVRGAFPLPPWLGEHGIMALQDSPCTPFDMLLAPSKVLSQLPSVGTLQLLASAAES